MECNSFMHLSLSSPTPPTEHGQGYLVQKMHPRVNIFPLLMHKVYLQWYKIQGAHNFEFPLTRFRIFWNFSLIPWFLNQLQWFLQSSSYGNDLTILKFTQFLIPEQRFQENLIVSPTWFRIDKMPLERYTICSGGGMASHFIGTLHR